MYSDKISCTKKYRDDLVDTFILCAYQNRYIVQRVVELASFCMQPYHHYHYDKYGWATRGNNFTCLYTIGDEKWV